MKIQENISLLSYNTFNIDCSACFFVEVQDLNDLNELRQSDVFKDNERLVLGGGSNVLFKGDFDGLVILNLLKGIELIDEDEESVWINVHGGENWHELVEYCVAKGWGGIENLALIPGSVGASPIQNIGAYGVELKDVFVSLEAFMWSTGETKVFYHEDCRFGYRDSVFKRELKGKVLISSVTLKLSRFPQVNTSYGAISNVLEEQKVEHPSIADVCNAVIQIRRSKLPDPEEIGNAGSFFKNPELPVEQANELFSKFPDAPRYVVSDSIIKIPAGWMIDQCGWKGFRKGDAGVHAKQALVLVNHGSVNGNEITELAQRIMDSVENKFGVALTPEVNIIG